MRTSSKERISTRADSKEKPKLTQKTQTKISFFQIYYNEEKLLTIQIQASKTVKDLDKLLKHKLKDRFYNYMGLESVCSSQVLDYVLQNKSCKLVEIHSNQKFRILLEGQVYDLHIPTLNDFLFLKCLGKGASSTVYLVRHKQNCKMYALKQIQKTYISDFTKMEFLLREKKILTQFANVSPFSSKLFAAFESKDHLNFLLKYYPGGEMLYHLQNRKMNENEVKLYFCQVLLAIQNLHKEKIIFRDLKPQNILIDLKGNAVLSDFGLCKTNVKEQELIMQCCGSDIYMPPQVKNKIGYNYHADFYTLGAFLYEMLTGYPPYYNTKALNFPTNVSTQVRELCLSLLKSDPNDRLCDFNKIKGKKWLKNIDWQRLKNKEYQMPIKLNMYQSYIHDDFKQPLTFQEVNEPIFDHLFDFFFYMSDNQHGISKCYVAKNSYIKQTVSQLSKPRKKDLSKKEKSKDRSKSHKNSVQKFQKLLGKQTQLGKLKQKPVHKPEKNSSKNHTSKQSKSINHKKKSTQSSPSLHNLHKEQKKEKHHLNGQNKNHQEQKQKFNIYQKNIGSPKNIQMKSVKSGSLTSGLSPRSNQVNAVLKSPVSKRKNI